MLCDSENSNDDCPQPCNQISGYPTFCCPGDDSCGKLPSRHLQVGYDDGAGFDDLIKLAQDQCTSLKFCPVGAKADYM